MFGKRKNGQPDSIPGMLVGIFIVILAAALLTWAMGFFVKTVADIQAHIPTPTAPPPTIEPLSPEGAGVVYGCLAATSPSYAKGLRDPWNIVDDFDAQATSKCAHDAGYLPYNRSAKMMLTEEAGVNIVYTCATKFGRTSFPGIGVAEYINRLEMCFTTDSNVEWDSVALISSLAGNK